MKYLYDDQGYYTGPYLGDPEVIPENSMAVAPPDCPYGFIPRWDGAAWQVVPDHKGEKGFVGDEPFTITEYGPYPEGWSSFITPKPCYQYDKDGYYCGLGTMYNNNLPNHTTLVNPDIQDGFIPKWDGAAWGPVEDHKGEEGYMDGQPFEIKEYGPYPVGWSTTSPPPTPEEAAKNRVAAIKQELADMDLASIRALRIIDNGTDTVRDHQRLIDYETQASALRAEIKTLEVANE